MVRRKVSSVSLKSLIALQHRQHRLHKVAAGLHAAAVEGARGELLRDLLESLQGRVEVVQPGFGGDGRGAQARDLGAHLRVPDDAVLGRQYLSNATCLSRPQLLYVCFVVSRTTIVCHSIRHA